MKKFVLIFAILSVICIVISGFLTYKLIQYNLEYKQEEYMKNSAILAGKEIVDKIHHNANNAYNSFILDNNQIIEYVKKYINEINSNNYEIKFYAFDNYGIYIAHYDKNYKNKNAFLEKDINGSFYIKELAKNVSDDGIYYKSEIVVDEKNIKHAITYIKKDRNLNIYYACTIILDDFFSKFYSQENEIKNNKIFIIISITIFIILIILLTIIYQNKGFK